MTAGKATTGNPATGAGMAGGASRQGAAPQGRVSPGKARLALLSFLTVSAGVMVNLLWLQQRPPFERGDGVQTDASNLVAPPRLRETDPQNATAPPTRLASRLSESGRAQLEGRATEVRDWASRVAVGPKSAEPEMQAVRVKAANSVIAQDADNATPETIRAIQRELSQLGYEPGSTDGVGGLATRAAVMAYERDQNLPMTANLTENLLQKLLLGVAASDRAAETRPSLGGHAERVVRSIQETLSMLGYAPGAPDGRFTDDTERAIREFELDNGIRPTGRISGHLVLQLAKRSGRGAIQAGAGAAAVRR